MRPVIFKVLMLAIVQGAAELLPVSSSAHVIVAEKLLGLDPTRPQMTLLLVMLHTGTMFAVILYFWKSWKKSFFGSIKVFKESAWAVIAATFFTGVIGLALMEIIEKVILHAPHAQVEQIFGNMTIIGSGLGAAGLLIIFSEWRGRASALDASNGNMPDTKGASMIGAMQGLCLPFRGFSRSGATISAGLLLGMKRLIAEEFSFALAVVLTPPVIGRELWRLMAAHHLTLEGLPGASSLLAPSLLGMVFSFITGLLALRWLSSWLERGRWHYFGLYCLAASAAVFILHAHGF